MNTTPADVDLSAVPADQLQDVLIKLEAMTTIQANKLKTPLFRKYADEWGLTTSRVDCLFRRWLKEGVPALINRNLLRWKSPKP